MKKDYLKPKMAVYEIYTPCILADSLQEGETGGEGSSDDVIGGGNEL